MRIVEDFNEARRRYKRDDTMRPLWQIALLLPLALIYYPARAFVDFMDGV